MSKEINAGWVLTVLRARGFPLPDLDLLRQALYELDADVIRSIKAALNSIESGGGTTEEFDVASGLGRCLNIGIKNGMVGAGLSFQPGQVLQYCLLRPDGIGQIKKAINADAEAMATLVERFGRPLPETKTARAVDPVPGLVEDDLVDEPAPPRKTKIQKKEEDKRLGSFMPLASDCVGNTNHHVYGKSGALTFEIDIARAQEGERRQYTVRIEAARANASGAFVWSEKVIFQLTRKELHQAAAVFLGLSPAARFVGHGDGNEKWCELVSQSGGVFVKVGVVRSVVAVPIGKEDLYEVAMLTLRALVLNDPDMGQGVILDVLRLTSRATSASGG